MNSAIERLLSLRVTDIMAKRVVTVSPDQRMAEAACLLMSKNVTVHPVVDQTGTCVGILSATDYVRRLCQTCELSCTETVRDNMSPAVHTIAAHETLIQAARSYARGTYTGCRWSTPADG